MALNAAKVYIKLHVYNQSINLDTGYLDMLNGIPGAFIMCSTFIIVIEFKYLYII